MSVDSDLLGHYCKIFRLVCKDWTRVATKVYKTQRGKILFKRNFIGKVSGLFIRVMKTSLEIPFERFKFCSDSYDEEYFTELLHVCSNAISTLELNFVNPCNLRFPKRYPNLVLGKLRHLVFHVRLESFEPLQLEMPTLLEELFNVSPCMESLDLKVFLGTARTPFNALQSVNVMRKFGEILANNLPDGITTLKLHITLTNEQLEELTKRKLAIKTLDVYFQKSELSARAIENFFAKLSPTLLCCRAVGTQFLNQDIQFPVFSRLRYLSAIGKAPATIHYEKIFPVLQKLEICLWDNFDDILPSNCYSSSVTCVKFPYHVWGPSIFIRMGNCFPNLKKLTGITVCSGEALRTIFRCLRSLQVLDIMLGYDFQKFESLDEIFTGMNDFPEGGDLKFEDISLMTQRDFSDVESLRDLKGMLSIL